MKKIPAYIFILSILIVLTPYAYAVNRTLGVLSSTSEAYKGYTVFCPLPSKTTYLIDNYGRIVHTWESDYDPNLGVYLLEDGSIIKSFIRTDDTAGVEIISWDGTQTWEYEYPDALDYQHHDIEALPNGNVLIIIRDVRLKQDLIDAGRDPASISTLRLWLEKIIEVEPTGQTTGNIVWEWNVYDHLIQDFDPAKDNYGVVEDHPELIDVNFTPSELRDWIHMNSIDYNAEFDQILVGLRNISETWVIDHSTTTAEAAGHSGGVYGKGGDILYRWGNPLSYRSGTSDDQMYFGQHDANWIGSGLPGEGNMLVFNNGLDRVGGYSTVDEITPSADSMGTYENITPGTAYNPVNYFWSYNHDPIDGITSAHISSAQRLPNGNTLICKGDTGYMLEVKSDGTIVWEYQNSGGTTPLDQGDPAPTVGVFKSCKHSPDFPAFEGKDLTPQGYIEVNPIAFEGTQNFPETPLSINNVIVQSKITSSIGLKTVDLHIYYGSDSLTVQMHDDGTNNDPVASDDWYTGNIPPLPADTEVKYYIYAKDNFNAEFLDPPFASKDYNFSYTTISAVPANITTEIYGEDLVLSWDAVTGAAGYKVYSSDLPDGIFTEDSTGSLNMETWTVPIVNARRFYYVVAVGSE